MKALFKSLGFAVVGAGLSFAFLALIAIPLMAAWSRLHNPNTPLQANDVLIEPFGFLRLIGIPIAAAAFAACFALGWRKFAHPATGAPVEHRP
ncbi:MAG: hypothetical protein ACRD3E_03075 [Terriglobales bacterium]